MNKEFFLSEVEKANKILVGLGEEFNDTATLEASDAYRAGKQFLTETVGAWILPAWQEYCRKRLGDDNIQKALERLCSTLENKEYYVVSLSTNSVIRNIPWRKGQLVMPCGLVSHLQCENACEGALDEISPELVQKLDAAFDRLFAGETVDPEAFSLGTCPVCGAALQINTIYAKAYDERGYLDQWQAYRNWLQATMNRQILMLELGVDLSVPGVIRWPFEKIAFFQKKAMLMRVNERLYQLPSEIGEKGKSIPMRAVDFIMEVTEE
jgi:hypothetical protein